MKLIPKSWGSCLHIPSPTWADLRFPLCQGFRISPTFQVAYQIYKLGLSHVYGKNITLSTLGCQNQYNLEYTKYELKHIRLQYIVIYYKFVKLLEDDVVYKHIISHCTSSQITYKHIMLGWQVTTLDTMSPIHSNFQICRWWCKIQT